MTDLRLDTALLVDTGTGLDLVAAEFDAADTYAGRVADAVGDDELAEAIRSFAGDWKERRAKMRDSVANVAELVGAVGEQFEGVDSDLAKSLEES
ncbi:hypothetical protein [Isoptericola dokdonensis]|jgi:hypothetical protein|uniref:Uncharacterized protein n=1 Tax=Isoptericola dokdonensis DS-3 TaxID=1300344 RepID=A0A168FB22_9MICO|nr:hypothetical protein [Isoptericola dokdonensis]ANC31236.1 hypothetical protein I598_1687 [Isoptericola dokdonensis DS-3]